MKTNLFKYKLGLAIVGLFTVGLFAFVLMQAGATKQDAATDTAANNIADKLNAYIASNSVIPSSLSQIYAKKVPTAISYKKLSDSSYKFCATYKANSSNFDATGAVMDLATGSTADTSGDSFTDNTELFIDTAHHKGANCQTIKPPYIVSPQSGLCSSAAPTSICLPNDPSLPAQTPQQQAAASGDQASACGVDGYKTHYSGTVKSVATTDGSPIVPTADQGLIITIQPNGDTPGGVQTITIPSPGNAPISSIFNVSNGVCTSMEASGLKVGDQVSVFLDNSDLSMPNAMIDFSQAY